MRVVAGRFRGRRLVAPHGVRVRPTSEKVREALFSTLGDVGGLVVLDLFAGTGALGIEALSRGVERVVFVERDRAALASLKQNLASLSLIPPAVEVRRGDALTALQVAIDRDERYDLVFLDPPYAAVDSLAPKLRESLPLLISAGGRVVAEFDRRTPLELKLPLVFERRYGDTSIRIHREDEQGATGR